MILFLKHAAITIAALIAFMAALIAPIAWISQGMSDNQNDDTGRLVSLSAICVLIACALLILMLSGCATLEEVGRATYHACKDGLCG